MREIESGRQFILRFVRPLALNFVFENMKMVMFTLPKRSKYIEVEIWPVGIPMISPSKSIEFCTASNCSEVGRSTEMTMESSAHSNTQAITNIAETELQNLWKVYSTHLEFSQQDQSRPVAETSRKTLKIYILIFLANVNALLLLRSHNKACPSPLFLQSVPVCFGGIFRHCTGNGQTDGEDREGEGRGKSSLIWHEIRLSLSWGHTWSDHS